MYCPQVVKSRLTTNSEVFKEKELPKKDKILASATKPPQEYINQISCPSRRQFYKMLDEKQDIARYANKHLPSNIKYTRPITPAGTMETCRNTRGEVEPTVSFDSCENNHQYYQGQPCEQARYDEEAKSEEEETLTESEEPTKLAASVVSDDSNELQPTTCQPKQNQFVKTRDVDYEQRSVGTYPYLKAPQFQQSLRDFRRNGRQKPPYSSIQRAPTVNTMNNTLMTDHRSIKRQVSFSDKYESDNNVVEDDQRLYQQDYSDQYRLQPTYIDEVRRNPLSTISGSDRNSKQEELVQSEQLFPENLTASDNYNTGSNENKAVGTSTENINIYQKSTIEVCKFQRLSKNFKQGSPKRQYHTASSLDMSKSPMRGRSVFRRNSQQNDSRSSVRKVTERISSQKTDENMCYQTCRKTPKKTMLHNSNNTRSSLRSSTQLYSEVNRSNTVDRKKNFVSKHQCKTPSLYVSPILHKKTLLLTRSKTMHLDIKPGFYDPVNLKPSVNKKYLESCQVSNRFCKGLNNSYNNKSTTDARLRCKRQTNLLQPTNFTTNSRDMIIVDKAGSRNRMQMPIYKKISSTDSYAKVNNFKPQKVTNKCNKCLRRCDSPNFRSCRSYNQMYTGRRHSSLPARQTISYNDTNQLNMYPNYAKQQHSRVAVNEPLLKIVVPNEERYSKPKNTKTHPCVSNASYKCLNNKNTKPIKYAIRNNCMTSKQNMTLSLSDSSRCLEHMPTEILKHFQSNVLNKSAKRCARTSKQELCNHASSIKATRRLQVQSSRLYTGLSKMNYINNVPFKQELSKQHNIDSNISNIKFPSNSKKNGKIIRQKSEPLHQDKETVTNKITRPSKVTYRYRRGTFSPKTVNKSCSPASSYKTISPEFSVSPTRADTRLVHMATQDEVYHKGYKMKRRGGI